MITFTLHVTMYIHEKNPITCILEHSCILAHYMHPSTFICT